MRFLRYATSEVGHLPNVPGRVHGAVLLVSIGSPCCSVTRYPFYYGRLSTDTQFFKLNLATVHETVAMASIIDTILTVSFLLMEITKRLTLL